MDRDLEVHRLTARLRTLRRFGLDLCLGHMVGADDPEPVYVGRLGLTDSTGRRLLVDWRSPAAEPFFGATHANPMGLASRRRYRWTRGRISDYWDEVFTADGLDGPRARSTTSPPSSPAWAATGRRGCATCSAPSRPTRTPSSAPGPRGALVVDGGPGTGKTVVALHRTAYLLYSDPRLGHRRGGVLFVGPHQPYLAYVADVLPSLGEEGVQTCTLRDLVPEGAAAPARDRPRGGPAEVVGGDGDGDRAGRPALRGAADRGDGRSRPLGRRLARAPPTGPRRSTRPTPARRTTRRATRSGTSWSTILVDKHDEATRTSRRELVRARAARRTPSCATRSNRAWPLIEPTDLVGDLWSVPAYLRTVRALARAATRSAPLQRADAAGLDGRRPAAAGRRPAAARRPGGVAAPAPAARPPSRPSGSGWTGSSTTSSQSDDSEMLVMSMLRGQDLQERPGRRRRRCPAPTRTCWPARSRTSSWTRRRS